MITLTEQAAWKVKEMMKETGRPEKQFLRIGVIPGGCSGFTYRLGFSEEKTADDLEFEQHGVRILMAKENQELLQGTVIDYQESMMGGGFHIENPNAIHSCGCGSSFRTATQKGKPSEC